MKPLNLTIFMLLALFSMQALAQETKQVYASSDELMLRLDQLQQPHYSPQRTVKLTSSDTYEYTHVTAFILSRYRIDLTRGVLQIYREDRGQLHSTKEYYFKPIAGQFSSDHIGTKPINLNTDPMRSDCSGSFSVLSNLMDSLEEAMESGADSSSAYIEALVRAVTRALSDFLSCMLH